MFGSMCRCSRRDCRVADFVWNLIAFCVTVAADVELVDRPPTACQPCTYSSISGQMSYLCYDDRSSTCSLESTVFRSSMLDFAGRSADSDDSETAVARCRWSSRRTTAVIATASRPSGDERLLPDGCFRPDVIGCEWYTDCLEKAYPCDGTRHGYAVEYGSWYCRLFERNADIFSAVGRRWTRAVAKCLIEALVGSVLRSTKERRTCAEIRRIAHESHAPCYLSPGPGEPSVCDIALSDWIALVWTLRYALADTTTVGDMISSGLQVIHGCSVR